MFFPIYLDILNLSSSGTLVTEIYHFFYIVFSALKDRLDSSVTKIFDPTIDIPFPCFPSCSCSESYTLDSPADKDVSSFFQFTTVRKVFLFDFNFLSSRKARLANFSKER